MILAKTILQVRSRRQELAGSWGLVPTMGALHQGHLSLVDRSRAQNDHTAVTIFVNPTQFAAGGDFDKYPRSLEHDLELLKPFDVELVFAPANQEIYPPDFQTSVAVQDITKPLEGAARPGHFQGVATVVTKLFNIVQPDRAYFGQKDAQQVAMIRQLARDLNIPVEIIVGETIREADGLAMSSRNAYLSLEDRRAATVLYRALCTARNAFERGERSGDRLRDVMRQVLQGEPRARIEYTSAADPATLEELSEIRAGVLVSMAVWFGTTQLIDNFQLLA